MSLFEWIDIASTLGVEGLELYPGFFASLEPDYLAKVRARLQHHGLLVPMYCYSPDFTRPDAAGRAAEVAHTDLIKVGVPTARSLAKVGSPGNTGEPRTTKTRQRAC